MKTDEMFCCSCLVSNLCHLLGNFNKSNSDWPVLVSVA